MRRENPQQFPTSQPRAALSPCALGKGPRELLGFSQGSLSDGSDGGLDAQGWGVGVLQGWAALAPSQDSSGTLCT